MVEVCRVYSGKAREISRKAMIKGKQRKFSAKKNIAHHRVLCMIRYL